MSLVDDKAARYQENNKEDQLLRALYLQYDIEIKIIRFTAYTTLRGSIDKKESARILNSRKKRGYCSIIEK